MVEWLLNQAGDLNEFIALATFIAGGGLGVVRMLMAGRKRFEAMIAETKQVKAQGVALQESISEIVAQLKPNGGSSMFDMVKSAHKMSVENAAVINHVKESLDTMKAMQWQFAETLVDKPIWECDPSGQCIRVNTTYAKLAERTVSELLGSGWENFVHPEDRARVYEEWSDAITRKRIFEGSFRVRSRSGKIFMVRATSSPVVTEGGKVTSFLGQYDEVTPLP